MLSLTPSMTPADTHGVFKLLDLLTDPNAVKQRLEELVKAKQELDSASEQATTKLAALASAKAENAAKVERLNRASLEHTKNLQEIQARTAQLSAAENQLRKKVITQDAAHADKTVELSRWEDRLRIQQNNHEENVKSLAVARAEVETLREQLRTKLAKIKEINDAVL